MVNASLLVLLQIDRMNEYLCSSIRTYSGIFHTNPFEKFALICSISELDGVLKRGKL